MTVPHVCGLYCPQVRVSQTVPAVAATAALAAPTLKEAEAGADKPHHATAVYKIVRNLLKCRPL